MQVIKSPDTFEKSEDQISIFLGGSIDKTASPDWREALINDLSMKSYQERLVVINPRHDGWANRGHRNTDNQDFRTHVRWELNHQSKADLLVYYFCNDTVSPITLLEFGIHHKKAPVVVLEPQYQRFDKMVLTCEYLGVPFEQEWDGFVLNLDQRINDLLAEKR